MKCDAEYSSGEEYHPFASVQLQRVHCQVRHQQNECYHYDLACFEPDIKCKQAPSQLLIVGHHKTDRIGKPHTMYESEPECQNIINTDRPGGELFLKKIGDGGKYNGAGYQKLHPFAVEPNDVKDTQGKGKGMPDGERGHKYQYLFPVAQQVNSCQCCNEE